MKDNNNSTGKRIKKTIKERKTTQPEVADKADISKSYLHNIKAGISKPSIRVLARIAKALNVSIDYLKRGKH
jgi:transcriptional regulator with XRE-family HTH domain